MITTKVLTEWVRTSVPVTNLHWTVEPDMPNKPDRMAQIIRATGRTEMEGLFDIGRFAIRFRGPFNHREYAEQDAEALRLLIEQFLFPVEIGGHGVQYIVQLGTPYGLPIGGQDRRQIVIANYEIAVSTDISVTPGLPQPEELNSVLVGNGLPSGDGYLYLDEDTGDLYLND